MAPRFPSLSVLLGVLWLGAAAWAQTLDTAVQAQIEELQAEKAARTPAQQKMDGHLVLAAKRLRRVAFSPRVQAVLESSAPIESDGAALVDLKGTVSEPLLAAIRASGGRIVASVPGFYSVRARIPLGALEALAERAEVSSIRQAAPSLTMTGPINSQGDTAHRTGGANGARALYGVTGAGVKVGVLSDSAAYLSASQAAGELGPVTVLQDLAGLTGEGTAMLEIVHDIAPGAELYFATADVSEASFAQNILNLRAAGCDIICDDVIYVDESPFQDGPVAQAIEQVVADGAVVFTAAGNEGSQAKATAGAWEGDFRDGGASAAPIIKAGRLHRFGAVNYNMVTAQGLVATLFWNDPAGGSSNDYDLYILNAAGTSIVYFSNNTQNGSQDPVEYIFKTISANTRLVVVKAAGAADRYLQAAVWRGKMTATTNGKISGHCGCAATISTAAVSAAAGTPFTEKSPVESFSSDGPRRMFFNADGSAVTPGNFTASGGRVLAKPDLAAADGVLTSVPGFTLFYGTSAAAPHAAGIAALIKSQRLAMSGEELRAAVLAHTLDIESAGRDNISGAGLIQAGATLASIPAGAKIEVTGVSILSESFNDGHGATNGAPDPGETLTVRLAVRNSGAEATSALTAKLQGTGGVAAQSGPVNFGAVAAGGGEATGVFSFRANGAAGTQLVLRFHLSDGGTGYGDYVQSFQMGTLGPPQTFSNAAGITINDRTGSALGTAIPYPSNIGVSGITQPLGKVTVGLNGFTHPEPAQVDILLSNPTLLTAMLLSDTGGSSASNVNLVFDDAGSIPATPGFSGTYHPADLELNDTMPSPAPAGPYPSALSAFNGNAANGNWSLYVADDTAGSAGSISRGWTLNLYPALYQSVGTGSESLAERGAGTGRGFGGETNRLQFQHL